MRALANHEVEAALKALADLVDNRWSGPVAVRLFRLMKVLREVFAPVLEARDHLIRQHADGDTIGPSHPAWPEFAPEYDALMREESGFVPHEPVVIAADLPEGLSVKPESLSVLDALGLIRLEEAA